MKAPKGIWLSWLIAALGLFTAGPLSGQNADTPKEGTPSPDQTQAEEPVIAKPLPPDAEEDANDAGGAKGVRRDAIVAIGKDAELKAGDTAEAVVVIGGTAKVHGRVRDAVVAIGGDAEVDGQVGNAVVAILGNVKALPGASIRGEAVAVGGKIEVADGANVRGHAQEVDLGGLVLPEVRWLRDWFRHCALLLRPLAPQVGWLWIVVGAVFLFYLLVAAVFPRPVQACVEELTRRPATTFLMGLLTKLLLPLVLLLVVALTAGIGIFVVPFVLAALFLAAVVGKVALLEWVGLKIGRQTNAAALQLPLVAFVVGTVIVLVLYMIPVLGLLTFAVLSVWGLGTAVTAAFGGARREMPEKTVPPASAPFAPAMATAGVASSSGAPYPPQGSASWAAPAPSEFTAQQTAIHHPASGAGGVAAHEPPVLPDVLAYPKGSFWERMGAAFLDVVLVSILSGFIGGLPWGLLVALAYFAGMWAWKGTTIGGIVLGLKVVRVDGQPVTFPVALVRALSAALSIVVLFLGFLAIAWDSEKQGWHDKIAGTVVLRLPRGTPLV